MRWIALAVLLLLPSRSKAATTIDGSDFGEQDLICGPNPKPSGAKELCLDGDYLRGTFTNVGLFEVRAGTRVKVSQGDPLVIYAATISIRGILDGTGKGESGGGGGPTDDSGLDGDGGGPSGIGGGGGGAVVLSTSCGGGGGGGGGAGGRGAGAGGGAGGSSYGALDIVTSPLSPDDVFGGSGGGGGAGDAGSEGGSGANGGASIYLEASSMTVSGSGAILASGANAPPITDSAAGWHPAAGGGGGGGNILLRIPGMLDLTDGVALSAGGGKGGDVVVDLVCGLVDPGGGGGGGRIKIFRRDGKPFQVTLSTAGGAAGGIGFCGNIDVEGDPLAAGAEGTMSFGTIASSPTGAGVGEVYVSSISWVWSGTASWGDGANPEFRVYPSSVSAPYPGAQVSAGSAATGAAEEDLTPNTTYYRFVTAFTDWGDSLPSTIVSTHTLANIPASPAFDSVAETGLTLSWTGGAPENPSYTIYEVVRALDSGFSSAVSTDYVVGLSSSPAGLTPNTTYYLKSRAVNLDDVPTEFTAPMATATLAAVPASPAVAAVHLSSAALSWSDGGNPSGTLYRAEISSDNFFTVTAASETLATGATFFNLTPGIQYYLHVSARNHNNVDSAFCATLSTVTGDQSDTTPPTTPGAPQPDRAYSYDGDATFTWSPAQSAVGILDYYLEIGTSAGADDFYSGNVGNVLVYASTGMASGKTYYARVRGRSNAGVYSEYSEAGPGVIVFVKAQEAPLKPINWPNPFDPAQGATQIGFYLDEPATVTLKIYTLQGGLVHEETRGESAGNQVWTWNGANDTGRTVAPGGYVVVIRKSYSGRVDTEKFKIAVLY